MCDCKEHIVPQEYGNEVIVLPPFTKRFTCIDKCLLDEISLLWSQGIETTGCCCGHNKWTDMAFIGVKDEYIDQMKELGYAVMFNQCRPDADDTFKPKSI